MIHRFLSIILLCLSAITSVCRAGESDAAYIPSSGMIIYGINFRDFTGTPGKALGDGTVSGMMKSVAALKNHGDTPLDYLVRLGIDALRFTQTDACGSADDYRTLIEAAHARGLEVILDTPTADSDIYTNLNTPACRYVSGHLDDASLDRFYSALSAPAISYAENYDTDRVAYRARLDGVSGVKGTGISAATNRMRRLGSLAAQMLMCPGPHMIWQFEELGADQVSLNADGTPNQAPKTVLWNNLNNQLYLSLHDTYAALCNIRRQYPHLFDGSASCRTSLSSATERYISLTDGETDLFLLVNPAVSGTAVIAPEDAVTGKRINLTTPSSRLLAASPDVTPTVSASGVSLPGGAFAVYVREHESALGCIKSDRCLTPHVTIIDGVITPLDEYNTLTVRTTSGIALRPDTGLRPGIYLVTVDGCTLKVVVQ